MTLSTLRCLLCVALCLLYLPARAQLTVDIAGAGTSAIPMAVAAFAGDAELDVAAIVKADLAGSEAFRLVDSGFPPLPDDAPPSYTDWRERGADAVLVGAVERQPAGQLRIRFMLHDAVRGSPVGGMELLADARSARSVGHRIADYIYEKLTGAPGVFSTRIAYVAKRPGRYELHVAEASGENPQIALASWHPIISPAWSPDGTRLAYVSFESKKPVVYVHSLATGKRSVVANFRGSNSAPAWSPDGGRLAVVLTKDGTSQLYTIDADGTDLKVLSQAIGIDTEPCYSPDGRFIYFTSDRGGSPQIYRIPAAGGAPERLTFERTYNVSPHLSPDGKTLAHITRTDTGFKLATLDLDTRQVRILTDSDADESPSFAPNGRLIALATTNGGQGILSVVSADGRFRKQLAIAEGDLREPAWGPYLK